MPTVRSAEKVSVDGQRSDEKAAAFGATCMNSMGREVTVARKRRRLTFAVHVTLPMRHSITEPS